MNYPDSVRFLYSLGNEVRTAKLGLERIGALLEALGNPERGLWFAHVAGTNGKGSTCAMIESGLRSAGFRTGLYTSPHLLEPVERIRIAGEPVTSAEFAEAFDQVHAAAEDLLRAGAIDLHPTYFETVTAMALLLFRRRKAGRIVLEVGLGGRLDATNVVMPAVCAITQIDFDHEAWLGKSLEAIAGEKAGILKRGVPAVIAAQRAEVEETIAKRASEVDAPCVPTREWEIRELSLDALGSRFVLRRGAGPGLRIECSLAGEHQVENARTAGAVLEVAGVGAQAIEEGIRSARWPGRLEHVGERPEMILDGAHNPAGARALRSYLERFYGGRRVWLIYGAMRDKAVAEVTGELFSAAAEVIVTAPRQTRAVRPEAIAELAEHPRLRPAADLAEAIGMARAGAGADDVIVITGSLFLVAEAKSLL